MSNSLLVEPSEIATGSKRSLGLSVVATTSVAVIPTFIAFALLVFSQPDPYVLAAVISSVVLTTGAAVAGAAIWARQPESAGVSFGDLMLWSWIRYRHAEHTLMRATRTLGLDRSGRSREESSVSQEAQVDAMLAIARALDSRSSYTLGHSRRVAHHARRVAEKLDVTGASADELVLAAWLHDVGNIGLPDAIVRKSGELTPTERSSIEAHVLLGASMVEHAGGAGTVAAGIRYHHEQWKGDGYPDGLVGLQIPLFARVISIAEAFDAMTSTRPYRQGFGTRDAVTILRSEAGSQFDPELVEIFVSTLKAPFSLAESIPFFSGIRRHLRELWLVFKRIGAVALSATATTIAIALILGSNVLSPGTPPDGVGSVDLAEGGSSTEPVDEVLGSNLSATEAPDDGGGDTAVSDPGAGTDLDGAATGESVAPDGVGGSVSGGPIAFDPGDESSGGGGGANPGGGTDPGPQPSPDGGGDDDPDPSTTEPPPDSGGSTEPDPENEKESSQGEKDKNPDANGNGNAHGHDKGEGEGGKGKDKDKDKDGKTKP